MHSARMIGERLLLLICFCLTIGYVNLSHANDSNEAKLKVAFLYNVLRMVQWSTKDLPKEADLLICLMGDNNLGESLFALKRQKVKKHKIKFQKDVTLEGVTNCHVLLINGRKVDVNAILPELATYPILTIGDTPKFAHRGGMVNLEKSKDKIRVEINLKSVKAARLKIRSRLLSLADIIEK